MINISTRISLSSESKRIIKKHIREKGLTKQSWSEINKKVKNDISKKLLFNQDLKCAYCHRYLFEAVHQIDHFAHKADYPQFTFITTNLFYACNLCNSSGHKGSKNTIDRLNLNYNDNSFKILHPYFDDIENEIKYLDDKKVYFDITSCSQKGKDTIIFFKLDDLKTTLSRIRYSTSEEKLSIMSIEYKALIRECIAYK